MSTLEWFIYVLMGLGLARLLSLLPKGYQMLQFLIGNWLHNLQRYIRAWKAFNDLFKAGFEITRSGTDQLTGDWRIYRFHWKNHILRSFPDIDVVDGKWVTMKDGHVENLDHYVHGMTPTSIFVDEWK